MESKDVILEIYSQALDAVLAFSSGVKIITKENSSHYLIKNCKNNNDNHSSKLLRIFYERNKNI
jgi:hypothetical protein